MKRLITGALMLTLPAQAAELQLRQVTLSASGVAQYEFTAALDGATRLQLDVPLDQVSDVLKSLRVDDPAGGQPAISLPGREPLSEAFRTLPFGRDALASTDALLGALIGAEIRIPATGAAGKIVAVSAFEQRVGDGTATVTRHRITVASATGLEMAVLEEVAAVEFTDPALRAQLGRALAAVAANSAQDRRRMEMSVLGEGRREIRVSYVVPAPAWKVSYRLSLPPGTGQAGTEQGGAKLQAFAVTENLSGRDWKDVALVLTSGQPVLYSQALYDPVQPGRPNAPVDVPGRPTPRVDQGVMQPVMAAPPPPPSPPPMGGMARMAAPAPGFGMAQEAAARPEPAQAAQAATQVEFRLAAPVNAASGQSLLLPVVDRSLPGRRVALYQPETDRLHPLVALELRNDTGAALPAGLAALFDAGGTFIGDARLPTLQPDETRLASFAVDLAVRVDVTGGQDVQFVSARATRGTLETRRRERNRTAYRIDNRADAARTVMVEQPRRAGWTLAEPAGAATTPTHWRVSREVAAGGTETLTVVQERVRTESLVLLDQAPDRLLALVAGEELSAPLKDALRRAATLRADMERRRQGVAETQGRIKAIVDDQRRVRDNLAAVPANSELQRGYLRQLQQGETELASLRARVEDGERGVRDAETALRDYLATLEVPG